MQHNRPRQLTALDGFSHDLVRSSPYPAVAARDLGRLAALATQVVDDVAGWADRLATMDCASAFNADRALLLVLESVFDEVLTPDGCRVLEAEIVLRRG
jgi:hypothetical protein